MKNKGVQLACVYIGVILGAGFASGQELVRFFLSFGIKGFWGLALSGILFAVGGWAILSLTQRINPRSTSEFIHTLFGSKLGNLIEWTSFLFMIILFCTMLAGSGALVSEAFGMNKSFGILLMAILCFITLLFDLKGFVSINVILSPVLIVGGILVGLYSIFMQTTTTFYNVGEIISSFDNWVFSALIYVAYNFVTTVNVLSQMKVDTQKSARVGGILGGFSMGLLGLFLAIPLYFNLESHFQELPMLFITKSFGGVFEFVYIFVLFIAIYTTAIANGFSVMRWLSDKIKINSLKLKLAFVCFAFFAAHIGFSTFVGKIYPIFGIIGLLELIVIILSFCLIRKK